MTGARTLSATVRARGPIVLLSILLHVAILLPIGLAVPRLIKPDPVDFETIPLDLMPAPYIPARRTRSATAPRDVADAPFPPRVRAPLPLPGRIDAPAPPTDGPVIEERWRVRPAEPPGPYGRLGRVASLPCPAAPGDRLGQRVCLTGSAMHRAEMPEGHADARPAGPDRAEQNREAGFERQRQANEAWRDYTRGEGAYPGLRSLFTDR